MSFVMEFWHAVLAVYASADMITLAIMLVIIVGAGWVLEGFEGLITATAVALVLFAVAGLVRIVVTAHGQSPGVLAAGEWKAFLGMTMQTLLVYGLSFALGISVIHTLRQIVNDR